MGRALSVLGGLSVRSRFLLAAAAAPLPLICLVAFSALDRYNSDRRTAEARATNRAELYAAVLAETGDYDTPTPARLQRLFQLSGVPRATTLAIYDGRSERVRAGASGSVLPTAKPAVRAALARRSGVVIATGADGVERVWGLSAISRSQG